MHPAYFETRFRVDGRTPEWPLEFAIITACAPTGTTWSDQQNQAADRRLWTELQAHDTWLIRLTGFAPSGDHAEPGWAVRLPLATVCEIGRRYLQDAIYFVMGDQLFVTHCDDRQNLVSVGAFRERVLSDPD